MIILLLNSDYDYRVDIALLRWQKISWIIITFWKMTTVPEKGGQRGDDGRNNVVSLLLR